MITPAWAQISSSSGAIQGSVTDPSGAAVPGSKVVVTNTLTGVSSEGVTQSDGTYVFAFLASGVYKVEVEAAGFRRAVLTDIPVQVTKVAIANVKLELGDITEVVMVRAPAQTVDTRTATVGDVLEGELVRNLPLSTRNFLSLTALQPGVSAPFVSPAEAGRGIPQLYVTGQRGTANNFVLNGVDANNYSNNNFVNVPVPNPDAVGEFRVSTSMYDATQGRSSGGNINVVQRSGTSELHGSAFWFYRSDVLNANDFFFNRNQVAKPVLLQNQFGFAAGGPIPRLKETFWFASYQGTRQKNGVAGGVSGAQPVLPATRDVASLAAAFGVSVDEIDPVAVAWLNRPGPYGGRLYPSGTGAPIGRIGSFSFSAPQIFNEDQVSGTFDRELFHNNRFSGKFFFADMDQFNPIGGGVSLGQGQYNPQRNWHTAVSDTHTLGPNLINEFHAGFTLLRSVIAAVEGTKVTDIGMTRFNQNTFAGTPRVMISGLLTWGGANTNYDQASHNLSYTFGDTLSYTRGKHLIRAGLEIRRYHVNTFNHFAARGFLDFSSFQNFLLGSPSRTFIGSGVTDRGFRAWDPSGFLQDDVRLTRRLTLNLGLRYDFLGPSSDIRGRIGNFDPSLLSAATLATGGPGLRDGFIAPAELPGFGTPGVRPSTLLTQDKNNWAPRIGLAYDVLGNGRLAVRAGYGIYYIRTSNQTLLQGITAVPFFQLSSITGSPVGTRMLANPFPTLPTPDQFPRLPVFPTFQGFDNTGMPRFDAPLLALNPIERTMHTPYAQHWNLTVQHEFVKGWVAEVGYLGSRGVKLLAGRLVNNALLVNADHPGRGGLTANSSRNIDARVPVPGFSASGLNMTTSSGESWYNALVLSVRHPFARGLNFKADYTFSKSLDNNSGGGAVDLGYANGNQLVPQVNKGRSAFDRTHRLVFTYLWEVPGPAQGWLKHALGGWSLIGVTVFQSGNPFDVVTNAIGNLAGSTSRANVTCFGPSTVSGSPSSHVDDFIRPCFAAPPVLPAGTIVGPMSPEQGPGTQFFPIGGFGTGVNTGSLFGNFGRNVLDAPFQQRFDLALTKKVAVHFLGEVGNLEFRTEVFKLFNTPIFNAPNSNVDSPSFGRITSTTDTTGRVIQFALKLNF
jgi:hypothetical protein